MASCYAVATYVQRSGLVDADADPDRRPRVGARYLQNGQPPERQKVVATAALLTKRATSAEAKLTILAFMDMPFAHTGKMRDGPSVHVAQPTA